MLLWQEMEVTPLQVADDGKQTEFDKKLPIVVYYHGGGFAVLRPDLIIYDKFCRRMARHCSVVVVSVHYRYVHACSTHLVALITSAAMAPAQMSTLTNAAMAFSF